ncbi:acetate kinase [Massilia sp. YIM B02769]|uniref:acetate kinase n=1 Tax=Massilia sp. YIM B02769 TaxID=3050129 RepID=UPI0025B72A88|nr:acetate kinase [Massilia sp. YIM B02769]MDN4058192.1 acetate kinase [Massilia sp. YIM B02769]
MHKFPALCVGALVVSAAFGMSPAQAQAQAQATLQPGAQSVSELVEQLKAMRQQLESQRARIDELERDVRTTRQAALPAEPAAPAMEPGALAAGLPATASELDALRGAGYVDQTAAQQNAQQQLAQPPQQQPQQQQTQQQQVQQQQQQAQQAQQRQQQQQRRTAQQNAPVNPQNVPANQQPTVPQPAAPAAPVGGPASAPAAGVNTAAVGRAPSTQARTAEVAPIFEQPGVLTPRGKYVFEPAVQYGYSSSSRVALVGYTVIPALLIGLIDVREVKRNTTTASVTLRRGLTNRFEVEAKLPYVYRSDATVSREVFTGTAVERAFQTSGKDLGDIELAARYQLNDGGVDKPFFIGGLRFKSRTGKDPFEVITDCTTRCVGENVTGSGLPLELPTGSGFYSLQPSLTWLFPSDPAVFFGSFSYLHNFKRSNIERTVLQGVKEPLGEVAPGGVFGFNFGMGLALNDKASFSLGYDHNSVGRTKQAGRAVPGSVRMQLGTLLVGYSYRLSDKRTLSVAVGAGVTRDTPDVTLMVRVPMSY